MSLLFEREVKGEGRMKIEVRCLILQNRKADDVNANEYIWDIPVNFR